MKSSWQRLVEVEKILNGDDGFWGLNEDHVAVGLMESGHTFFCDELQAVLNSGSVSQSHSESSYSIQRTLSSPPAGDVAGVGGSQRKRAGKSFKGGADVKPEKKKMKVCEDEESRFSEQNSNSNSKSTITAADSSRKHPAASGSDSNYIHVRARRGQATDSHSLAERARREKISERMKYLQDLVPGCSKVTGKAAMLDEIINYVQSLQREVELLSMKLAAVSPRLDHDIETNLPQEIYRSILPSADHFLLHSGISSAPLALPTTFSDSRVQQFSWENHIRDPFASSFIPRSFTGGFRGVGNVKTEML